tara:strand:- start:318 stop:1079 length:762 start_codon:yes stop_codon:yes gene_type:complete
MNELINYIILGMIQGLTEFFPVSSSGHLVLFKDFLKITNEGASAEIIAHFGTLFSILLFYKASFFSSKNEDDFFNLNNLKLLTISTIPAILFALNFDYEELNNYNFVKYSLATNGLIIILMSLFKNSFSLNFNLKSALLLGIFQSIAILPGISRSGMVISLALMLGLNKEKSIQYCFFMLIPVTILAIFYKLFLSSSGPEEIDLVNGLGLFLSSFTFGYLSLYFLVKFLKKFDFWWFGFYCIIISIIAWNITV